GARFFLLRSWGPLAVVSSRVPRFRRPLRMRPRYSWTPRVVRANGRGRWGSSEGFAMQQQPPRRAGSGTVSAPFAFEAKFDNEEQLLDAMLASLARGILPADSWERLHAAAQRDDRLSELAFAFETVSQGKRIKTVQPSAAAEFQYQAARYVADVL